MKWAYNKKRISPRKLPLKRMGFAFVALLVVPLIVFRPASAAIAFRAAASGNNAGGNTTVSIAMPTGTVQNDVMIAVISYRGGTNEFLTPPSGWSPVNSADSTTVLGSQTFLKVADVSEAGPYVFTISSSQKASGVISSYSGVDISNPVDAQAASAYASSTTLTAPSITTNMPNAWVIAAFSTATGTTVTPGSSMTERGESASTGAGAGSRTTTQLQDITQASPGSTGAKNATAGAGAVNVGHLIALRPDPSISQSSYRFFENTNSTTASTPYAAKDTAASIIKQSPFRLRLNLGVASGGSNMTAVALRTYTLQFAKLTAANCSAQTGYADISSSTAVQFYDNATPANGAAYVADGTNDPSRAGITAVGQKYHEANPLSVATTVAANQDALWDIALTTSSATAVSETYCIKVNGLSGTYSVYPQFTLVEPSITQANYRWFANADSVTPGSALAAQDTASAVTVQAPFRLRQRLGVDSVSMGASGLQFKLQYAEKSGTCDTSFTGETYADIYNDTTPQSGNAGTAANDTSSGSGPTAWTNPSNASGASNASLASISSPINSSTTSNWLKFTNFGFNIPTTATIARITVQIDGGSDANAGGLGGRQAAKLVKGGVITGTDQGVEYWDNATQPGTIDQTPTGWGVTLTPADVNSSNFGFALVGLAAYDQFGDLYVETYVDSVTVGIYYTFPDSPITYYNNLSVSNPTTISSSGNDPTNGARPTVYQSYLESDPFTNNVSSISNGSDGIWDFSLTSQASSNGKTYCVRVVKSDGSTLNTYSQIPEITITSPGPTLDQMTRGGGGVLNGVKQNYAL